MDVLGYILAALTSAMFTWMMYQTQQTAKWKVKAARLRDDNYKLQEENEHLLAVLQQQSQHQRPCQAQPVEESTKKPPSKKTMEKIVRDLKDWKRELAEDA